jgi:hypothetical protein
MIRTLLRHAGALRIDHVIGLFRLWWIPEGLSPAAGTYVRYDHEAMIGVLLLEAQRAGAVLIGEDLGNVEPWVRDYLSARGVLGTSVLWFEREGDGFRPPEQYRRSLLATVNTHDLPPTAGYLADEHVACRAARSADPPGRGGARRRGCRARDHAGTLRERGLLGDEPDRAEVIAALNVLITARRRSCSGWRWWMPSGAPGAEPARHRPRVPELADPARRTGRSRRAAGRPRGRPAVRRARARRRRPPLTSGAGALAGDRAPERWARGCR